MTDARHTRIIPRLDIKGPNLVKGVHLEGLRVLGQPEAFARWYSEGGADELIYLDVVASLYGRNSLLDFVSRTSAEIFIPLTVGGGLRSLDDIRAVLCAGADKVALNTAAVADPALITAAAHRFGSSAIVITIEAIETAPGKYEAFTNNGREATGLDAVLWAERAVSLGAGEVLLTSVDREGTGRGFDLALT
ncbi:MAG: imidazole glycerol phosphate synthase cyclase subunit, partial [Vicinamibacterales bacterium]